jgi:hypothetical protein
MQACLIPPCPIGSITTFLFLHSATRKSNPTHQWNCVNGVYEVSFGLVSTSGQLKHKEVKHTHTFYGRSSPSTIVMYPANTSDGGNGSKSSRGVVSHVSKRTRYKVQIQSRSSTAGQPVFLPNGSSCCQQRSAKYRHSPSPSIISPCLKYSPVPSSHHIV